MLPTPYPPGATPQISYSMSLNSLAKPTTNMSIYTVNNKSINMLTQQKDLGIPLPMIFIGVNIMKLLQPSLPDLIAWSP